MRWHAALVLPQARWVLETLPHKLVRGVFFVSEKWRSGSRRSSVPGHSRPDSRRRGLGLLDFDFESVSGRTDGVGQAGIETFDEFAGVLDPIVFSMADCSRFSLVNKQKERTPLPHSHMRQPQVFTTDVSVFHRHTSRGKPSWGMEKEVVNSSSERVFYICLFYRHSNPVDDFT